VRNKGLITFACIFVASIIASRCYAAPSCCDPGKAIQGNAAFVPSTQMLQAVPVAPIQPQIERSQVRRAVASGPQGRWIVPAAAPGTIPANQPVGTDAQAVPPCCAGANPSYVQPQGGCCGPIAPQALPQPQGCCGGFAASAGPAARGCCGAAGANVGAPRQGCCAAKPPAVGVPQGACCGQARAASRGSAGQDVRQAPGFPPGSGSCCSPAKGSMAPAGVVTNLPSATPVVNALGYAGPIQGPQGRTVTRAVQPASSRSVNQTIGFETGTSSFSYARQGTLW
jgi:hypothetical protein